MSEKGDLGIPNDPSISLPPNYAPSETFTDSPPPAYQRKNAPIIRIARMVCITVLAVTFLVGFFIVAHRWVEARHQVLIMEELKPQAQFLQKSENENIDDKQRFSEPVIQEASIISLPLDNNKIEDDIQMEDEISEIQTPIEPKSSNEDESVPPEQMLPPLPSFPPKGLLFPFQDQFRKIRPTVFGSQGGPEMIKPPGNCKVQKKSREIGPGIRTESVIVVCENEETFDQGDKMLPPPPPFLQPQIRPIDGPMPFNPEGPSPVGPPMSILGTILKVLASKKLERDNGQMGPKVIRIRVGDNENLPLPPLPVKPIRGETMEMPPPIAGPPKELFPMMNLLPFAKIEVRGPRVEEEQEDDAVDFLPPFHPRMRLISRFPPPTPFVNDVEGIPEMPQMRPAVKVIRINRPPIEEEAPEFPEDLPFPLAPLMKLLPKGRQPRVIRFRPNINNDNEMPPPFPLPPFMISQANHEIPHPMPEASGRALPDPVALPGIKMLRLPFVPPRQFNLNPRITHMEMKQEPRTFKLPMHGRTETFTLSPFQQVMRSNDIVDESFKEDKHFPYSANPQNSLIHDDDEINDFGPPRTHTLMQQPPQPIFMGDDLQVREDPNFHSHADGVEHSHPYDGPHTHIGEDIIPINPAIQDENFHVHEDGVGHSHPFDRPHSHIRGEILPLEPFGVENPDAFQGFENIEPIRFEPFHPIENPDFNIPEVQEDNVEVESQDQFVSEGEVEPEQKIVPVFIDEPLFRSPQPAVEFINNDQEDVYDLDRRGYNPEEIDENPIEIIEDTPVEPVEEPVPEVVVPFEPEEQLVETEPEMVPEEPTEVIQDPFLVVEPEVPAEVVEPEEPVGVDAQEIAYNPDGKIAPIPPKVEEEAEMIEPESFVPADESEVLIK